MLYRGIEYSVVQGIILRDQDIRVWQHAGRGNAEKAIERAIQKQRFKQDLGGED